MSTARTTSEQGAELDLSSNELIRHVLCSVNDVQNGQMKDFDVKTAGVNTSILLIKQNEKFHAVLNKCCHYKLPLSKGRIE